MGIVTAAVRTASVTATRSEKSEKGEERCERPYQLEALLRMSLRLFHCSCEFAMISLTVSASP